MISPFNNIFYCYLKNTFNLNDNLKNLLDSFNTTIDLIDEKKLLDFDFLKSFKKYPKYPAGFKPIVNINKYNILKIYDVYTSDPKYLISSIDKTNILNLKLNYDSIPDTKINIDSNIQKLFCGSISDDSLYFKSTKDPIRTKESEDYIFRVFGHERTNVIDKTAFSVELMLYFFLWVSLKNKLNTFNKLNVTASAYNQSLNKRYRDEFEKYIESNIDRLSTDIAEFLLSYTYKISVPSGLFLTEVKDIISKHLMNKLTKKVNSFLSKQESIVLNNVKEISSILYSKLSEILVHQIVSTSEDNEDGKFISEDTNKYFLDSENEKYNSYLDKITEKNFSQYLFLVYLYNKTPAKFLNVLQLVLDDYVKNEIKTPDDLSYNESEIKAIINKLIGTSVERNYSGFNFNYITSLLNDIINEDILSSVLIDDQSISYGFRCNMSKYFDKFLDISSDSNDFNTFIDDLLTDVFLYLNKTIQIDYKFNYFTNKKMLKLFIRGILQRDLLSRKIFIDREDEMYEIFDVYLSMPHEYEFNQSQMISNFIQYAKSNINKIHQFYENIVFTSIVKYLHDINTAYYLSNVNYYSILSDDVTLLNPYYMSQIEPMFDEIRRFTTWQINSYYGYKDNNINFVTKLWMEFETRTGSSFENTGARVWAYNRHTPTSGGYFFWSNHEHEFIQQLEIGTKVPVIIYDTVNNPNNYYYVAYASIELDLSPQKVLILRIGRAPNGTYDKNTMTEADIRAEGTFIYYGDAIGAKKAYEKASIIYLEQ